MPAPMTGRGRLPTVWPAGADLASPESPRGRRIKMHHTARRLRRLGLAVVGVLISATSLAMPVAAREAVDLATLNPPPPDFINAQCGWSGQQVICSFGYSLTGTDSPTGIFCDGGEMIERSDRSLT